MSSLLTAPVQKIARFLLKRVLGAYIKPHSLESEQIEVQLLDGELKLNEVELEPSAINPILARYRVALVSGSVRRLRLAVPVRRLMTDKSRIFLEGVRFEIAPLPADESGQDKEKTFGASETIAVLTRLVQQVLLNVEVFVDDISVVSVLPLKGGTVFAKVACREALALSTQTLHKSLCINDLVLEVSDHKLLVLPNAKIAVDFTNEQPEVTIKLLSVFLSLTSPDHVSFIDQLSRLEEVLDDSAMFQSFLSELPTPTAEGTVFWYEDVDNILSSLKQRTIELLEVESRSAASVDSKLRVKPAIDLSIAHVEFIAAIRQIDDQELRLHLRDVKLTSSRFELGEASVAVVTFEQALDQRVSVNDTNAGIYLSAMDMSSSARPLESPLGRRTPSSASAVSSPGVSTPGGSSVRTVESLAEGAAQEEPGEHEYETPFFQGTLIELVTRGRQVGESRRVVETSFILENLRHVVFSESTLSIGSDVNVTLAACDLAYVITTAGHLASRLARREVQAPSVTHRLRLPFAIALQGQVSLSLSCDATKIDLKIPSVAVIDDTVVIREACFYQNFVQINTINLSFSDQSLPHPKPTRSTSDSGCGITYEIDEWTEIAGKIPRRNKVHLPPVKKANLPATVALKSRLHEPACFQILLQVPSVQITCDCSQLMRLQIDLSTFADRFGAASIFYSQRIPVLPDRWAVASPVKVAVDVVINKARLLQLVQLNDTAVRIASFIEPQIGPVTQLGVSVREVLLFSDQECLSRSMLTTPLTKASADGSVRNLFESLIANSYSLNENIRLFMTPQPRRGQGMNTFVTLVYTIDVGGIELCVRPEVVNEFYVKKLIPFLNPPDVPLLPRPAQLSAKAFTMYKLHVNDLKLKLHPHLALTLRGLDTASGSNYQFEGGTPVKLAGITFKAKALEAWISKAGCSDEILVTEALNVHGALKLREQITEADLEVEGLFVEVSPDSLCRLKALIQTVKLELATVFRGPDCSTVKSAVINKVSSVTSATSNFTLEVDEDFVSCLAPSLNPQLRSPNKPGSMQQHVELPPAAGEARWLVDPKTVSVLHDHVTAKTLPDEKPRTLKALRSVGGETEVSIGLRLQLHAGSLAVRMYEGDDWSHDRETRVQSRSARSKKSFIALELSNSNFTIQAGKDEAKGVSVLSGNIRLGSIDIRDGVLASLYQFLISRLDVTRDTTSPQLSGNFVLAADSEGRRGFSADVSVAPLCVTVDQDAADFVTRFLEKFSALEYLDEGSATSHDEADMGELLVENLSISTVVIELNYRAKRVSMAGLRRGDPIEYLNLLPFLEGLQLRLSELRLSDVGSVGELIRRIFNNYMNDINKSQILRSLSNLTPIRSLKNIFSKGLAQLISQPFYQMQRKDGRVSKGIVKGVHSFFRTLLVESLAMADVAVSGAHAALSTADAALLSRSLTTAESEVEVNWEGPEDATLEWTPVERGATGQRPYIPNSPVETLELSSAALLRGIFSGIQGVRDAERGGEASALSVVRGLPLFVLRPALGATEALSVAVKTARGVVDATSHKEQSRRFKAPFARGGNF